MKKVFIGLLVVVVVAVVVVFAFGTGDGSKDTGPQATLVEKGEIVEKAMAIGTIEPYKEIIVKSKISGIVEKLYVEIGDVVTKGDLLMEISPQATPLEYTEATRNVDIADIAYQNAKTSFERAKELRERDLISDQEFDDKKVAYDQAEMRLNLAKERLQLLEEGSIKNENVTVESTIRAPTTGSILSRNVNEGDPVVPLTSYQEGTALITLADMNDLIFRGTVDEIDVGKLREGMPVKLKIGALPKDTVEGTLYKISPKARKENSATVFDVEVRFNEGDISKLRAGYSATAEITIKEARDILVIPERYVDFRNDSTFVMVQDSLGGKEERYVETGLSDGITIQIKDGLEEGEMLAERTAADSE